MDAAQTTAAMELMRAGICFAANISLTGLMAAFVICVFGRDTSLVYRMPAYMALALKAALAWCTAGALFAALTPGTPTWSETLFKVGLTVAFGSTLWWYHTHQVKPWRTEVSAASKLEAAISASKRRRAVQPSKPASKPAGKAVQRPRVG